MPRLTPTSATSMSTACSPWTCGTRCEGGAPRLAGHQACSHEHGASPLLGRSRAYLKTSTRAVAASHQGRPPPPPTPTLRCMRSSSCTSADASRVISHAGVLSHIRHCALLVACARDDFHPDIMCPMCPMFNQHTCTGQALALNNPHPLPKHPLPLYSMQHRPHP